MQTEKSKLPEKSALPKKQSGHEFHINNVQTDRKIDADMKKTGIA